MKAFPINDKINEYDYDPDLGVGVPWIRKTLAEPPSTITHTLLQLGLTARAPPTSGLLTHTLLHIGLTATPILATYALKVRSKSNEILKINLEKEI